MLIIITSSYPFGGEPFLQNESPHLPKDAVFFAISADTTKKTEKESRKSHIVGDGRASLRSYFYALCGLFDKEIYNELRIIKKRNKLSAKNVRKMFSTYASSRSCYKKIVNILEKEYANCLSEKITIYSYWMEAHAVIASLLKRKYRNAKIVSRCHGYDLYEYRHESYYIPFRQKVLNDIDLITPISQDGKEYIINTYGKKYADKIQVCRLGTMDCGLNPSAKTSVFTIASCSNIVKVKRLELIVRAIACLQIPVKWIHFGDGDQSANIRELARNLLDEKKNVEYIFKGKVDKEDILKYYADNHIDLFVNTSESEGIPVSIMEAMSFGIPVVATDVGGTCEIVKTGENGHLLEKDDSPNGIAKALMEFAVMDNNRASILRTGARRTWYEEYREDENFGDFAHLIETL